MQKWLSVPVVIITCEGTINEENSLADIRCRRFSDILRTKEDHYPYSDRYISEVHDSSTKTGRTEREHMVEWFRANETKGSGSYSRQTPNSSARRCCNSLMNAASLLWIAEAVGIDELTVKIAYEAAVGAGDHRRACGRFERSSPGTWSTPAYSHERSRFRVGRNCLLSQELAGLIMFSNGLVE